MKLLCAVNPQPRAPKLTLVYGGFVMLKPDADGRFRLTESQRRAILTPKKAEPGERSRCGCFHY